MSSDAIYFPYINVPDTNWFHRILLYWDKINSIVPSEYVRNASDLAPHMRDLVSSGLVTTIQPYNYVYQIPNFTEAFLNYIDHRMAVFERNEESVRRYQEKLTREPVQLIHIEKLQNIAEELQQRRLAFPTIYPWYALPTWVSQAFMAYLAACLGRINEIDADPVTNEYQSSLLFSTEAGSRETIQYRRRRSEARQLILSNLLPTPRHRIPLNEIVNFKHKHGDQLRRFRQLVESKCIALATIEDDQARLEQIDITLTEMNQDINEISDLMRAKWRDIILGSIIPLLAIGTSIAAVDYSQPIPLVAGLVTTGLTLTNTVYQAFSNQSQRRAAMQKPIAYTTYARHTLSRH